MGQNRREEIDIIVKEGNYGWNIMEGNLCFSPSTGCNPTGLILPIHDYGRSLGTSVTGGYVYRGRRAPSLGVMGALFFSKLVASDTLTEELVVKLLAGTDTVAEDPPDTVVVIEPPLEVIVPAEEAVLGALDPPPPLGGM